MGNGDLRDGGLLFQVSALDQCKFLYLNREGYLRTSSSEYKLDDCDNQLIHLTNNAVQKNAAGYGRFEDGNQLSFKDL